MKPKLIFLDLEGTLVRIPNRILVTGAYASMWAVLAEIPGKECYKEELRLQRNSVKA